MFLTRRLLILFLLPAGLLLFMFLLVPAVWSMGQSFTNFTLLGPDALSLKWLGFENYRRALHDPAFWKSFRVSVIYVAGSALVGQVVVGMLLALLTQGGSGAVLRVLAVMAWIVPGVVVAILWNVYLHGDDGTLNRVLGMVGISGPNWLMDRPLLAIVVFNTWRGAAFSMLLFDAALRSIPASYLEAAAVSGASPWRGFWDVTFPLLRPQLVTDLILITLWTFNDFGPYLLTGGGPGQQTEVLPIYTWRTAFRSFELGYGAALSTILLAVNFVLAVGYQRMLKR